ncbi:MAG: sigma-70 family RNA polymerase sigma factor [Chloroflexi bacterium]|nr:MAG: sigma-70 family RNA polymerase sigma factor [Chloroflexota bacterium]
MNAEHTWIVQAQRGDQQAFAKLVEAYQGPVYNLAYRMLGNADDAADAAQETFLRAYAHLASYDPKRKFSSWLLTIASNYCIDQLRRRRINWVSVEELPPWETLRARTPDPEESAIRGSDANEIQEMLNTLPPDYRLAVVLRYWYDYSYQDIAAMTNSTVSAVKSRLHRARRMLAEVITATPYRERHEPPDTENPYPQKGALMQCIVQMPAS